MAAEQDLPKCPAILLVEDDSDYASLLRDTIHDPDLPHVLHTVGSGEEAIAYLSGTGKYADRSMYPLPFLMILDLKMPGTGGFGVLRWLSSRPDIRHQFQVVTLSSTESFRDVEVVYELGAQFFWPKSDGPALREKVRRLKEAWLRMN